MIRLCVVAGALVVAGVNLPAVSEDGESSPRRIVLDEQQIEGKIRRPQLVMIKAEQRPDFSPMIMQSLGGNVSVVEFVSSSALEQSPYDSAFQFSGRKITSYVP